LQRLHSSFVLGYQGCDESVAEDILSGTPFKPSNNDFDWLGPGIYFWEANPIRGLEYASEIRSRGRLEIHKPAVIGAVIDLGYCLDLTTSSGIQQVRDAHRFLTSIFQKAGQPLPQNNKDRLRRNLDCAVLRFLHDVRKAKEDAPLETIKGVFMEGKRIYPTSGFWNKTHIQICVCNPDNIKGVFRVDKRFLA
jgi:hypothetical protein